MMALVRHMKLLLTFGSLASALALPGWLQKTLGDDEDNDDTPLPLVIWHGK